MVPSGRLAEIVGDVGIPLDKYARILSKKLLFDKGTKQTLGRMPVCCQNFVFFIRAGDKQKHNKNKIPA